MEGLKYASGDVFLIVPLVFVALSYYAYEEDLVECEGIACETDELSEREIDKFDLKMQHVPSYQMSNQ